MQEINSLVCVGLDPHASDVAAFKTAHGITDDAEAAFQFSKVLVDATQHVAAAYKPNAAFFEALGAPGVSALERLVQSIPAGIPVVLDVKRGDISTTAEAYATAAFDSCKAHCVTLSPYMGSDSIMPFVGKDASRGAFVLCKTSNPSSEDLETVALSEGGLLYERVAQLCEKWNDNNNVGLVVGATDVEALARSRAAAPSLWILAPGVGFQGGDLEAAAKAGLREDGMGLLVPVSRGISRAEDPKAAAEKFRDMINGVRSSVEQPEAKRAKVEEAGEGDVLAPYQKQFFELALKCEVLKFGKFTLKSGRESPYFFNAGLFNSGSALDGLGDFYAEAIVRSGVEFDVLFGPAYKGIPLASVIATSLYRKFGKDVPVAYNRKEKKDHGEGGLLVGAPVRGKRVLVVDDVITAGTAIRECIDILSVEDAKISGVVIALDRQERAKEGDLSAIQAVKKEFGFDVHSIVCLDDLLSFLRSTGTKFDAEVLSAVEAYRKEYGVDR